jgi:uncharacterized protein
MGGVPLTVLAVIQPGVDGLVVHRSLRALGLNCINYLLPDFTHDTIGSMFQRYGPTPCADFLLPILEYWWDNESVDVRIGLFWYISQLILGGGSQIDIFGNQPLKFVFIESDGSIEGLDVLRVCGEGLASTGLHVLQNDFDELTKVENLQRAVIFDGLRLPAACRACPEQSTCAGGYLPHRYSAMRGFNNASIWCADILKLFGRLRYMLGVSVEETVLRRTVLESLNLKQTSERMSSEREGG